jgi:hypothetical protein
LNIIHGDVVVFAHGQGYLFTAKMVLLFQGMVLKIDQAGRIPVKAGYFE